MDTCYNCMYKFGTNEMLEDEAEANFLSIPNKQAFEDAALEKKTAANAPPKFEADESSALFGEFLIEFERFLGDFVANRVVRIE